MILVINNVFNYINNVFNLISTHSACVMDRLRLLGESVAKACAKETWGRGVSNMGAWL